VVPLWGRFTTTSGYLLDLLPSPPVQQFDVIPLFCRTAGSDLLRIRDRCLASIDIREGIVDQLSPEYRPATRPHVRESPARIRGARQPAPPRPRPPAVVRAQENAVADETVMRRSPPGWPSAPAGKRNTAPSWQPEPPSSIDTSLLATMSFSGYFILRICGGTGWHTRKGLPGCLSCRGIRLFGKAFHGDRLSLRDPTTPRYPRQSGQDANRCVMT